MSANRSEVLKYIIEKRFHGDIESAASVSGIDVSKIEKWISGAIIPRKNIIDGFIHLAQIPEFSVIREYFPVSSSNNEKDLRQQVATLFQGHETSSGLYAFYDSMVNLVYIGKSYARLKDECHQALNQRLPEKILPTSLKLIESRKDVVCYISAYSVIYSGFGDFSRHIESLILRISKPRLNKNIGSLEPCHPFK